MVALFIMMGHALLTAVRVRSTAAFTVLQSVLAMAATVLFMTSCSSCSKPEPPEVKAESATVKKIDATGPTIEVTLNVQNPNDFKLVAQSVKARVKVGDNLDLGEVIVPSTLSIPANKSEKLVVPLELGWTDVTAIAMLAINNKAVPYKVTGTAEIGTEKINFDVPFEVSGELTPAELMKASEGAAKKLPLPLPF